MTYVTSSLLLMLCIGIMTTPSRPTTIRLDNSSNHRALD